MSMLHNAKIALVFLDVSFIVFKLCNFDAIFNRRFAYINSIPQKKQNIIFWLMFILKNKKHSFIVFSLL